MERVGNLLGQFANLRPRDSTQAPKRALNTPAAKAVSSRSDDIAAIPAVPSSTGEVAGSGSSSTPGSSERINQRSSDYQPQRRRAGAATDLTRIRSILSRALAHKGLDKKIERYEFILHWEEIVGETLARISKPECIVNKTLIVKVIHSTWAQELAFMKPVLIQKVTPYLRKGDVVSDIVFRIGSIG